MKLLQLAALLCAFGAGEVQAQDDTGSGSDADPTQADWTLDCGMHVAGDQLYLSCPWSVAPGGAGDPTVALGFECLNARYVPATTCPYRDGGELDSSGSCTAEFPEDFEIGGVAEGECSCPYYVCDDADWTVDCGTNVAGEAMTLDCPWSVAPGGGDATVYLGFECLNARYVPATACPDGVTGSPECMAATVSDWEWGGTAHGECTCPYYVCDDHGCENANCPAVVVPDCEEGMQSRYVAADPSVDRCCAYHTECEPIDGPTEPQISTVVYKTDPWDRVYQWSHYYDEVNGEPIDSRVPKGWDWNKHGMGTVDFGCAAQWNIATNAPDTAAHADHPSIREMNVCGVDSGKCCVRGWRAATMFCQVFSECTLIDFMDEDPGDFVPRGDHGNDHEDSTHAHFLSMMDINDLADGSTYGFYDAITDPIYVLRGGSIERAPMHADGRNPVLGHPSWARFWSSTESPMKCPDGTLKDCHGRCYGAPMTYSWNTMDVNMDISYDPSNFMITEAQPNASAAGVWEDLSKCYLQRAGNWWFGKSADGSWWVKNRVLRAAQTAAANAGPSGYCALVDGTPWFGVPEERANRTVLPHITRENCERLAAPDGDATANGSAGNFGALGGDVLEWVEGPLPAGEEWPADYPQPEAVEIPPYTEADFANWVMMQMTLPAAEAMEYEVTVACSYSPYGSCRVYGLDWTPYEEGDCRALHQDYVCDKGQRILSSGELGPDLNCEKWNWDNGDCECEPDRTMTCSGYCLSDADCISDVWGKNSCQDWLTDDVCDYGQRISNAQITMHFECAEWKFDNGACCPDGQVNADGTCVVPQDYTCPDEPMGGDAIEGACPSNMDANDQRTWTPMMVMPVEEPTAHPNASGPTVDIYKISGDVESIRAELEHMSSNMSTGPRYVTDDPALNREPPSIHDQERVWVSYFHSGYFYEAVIDNHNGPNGIEVTYRDGDHQNDVERDEIFALEDWAADAKVWRRSEHGDWDMAMVQTATPMTGDAGGMQYELMMGNGDIVTEWNDWEQVRPEFNFELGDHVWAERDGNLRWFKGVVTNMFQQGDDAMGYRQYDVTYTNGETDVGVRAPYMFLIHPKRIISVEGAGMDEEGICQIVESSCNP